MAVDKQSCVLYIRTWIYRHILHYQCDCARLRKMTWREDHGIMPKKKNVQLSGNASPETGDKRGTRKEESWKPGPPMKDPQPYDNNLKAWFGEDARLIIREFLHDVELLGENSGDLNIEIDRTKLKADLVY